MKFHVQVPEFENAMFTIQSADERVLLFMLDDDCETVTVDVGGNRQTITFDELEKRLKP